MNTIVYKIRHIPTGKFYKKRVGCNYLFSKKGKIWYKKPLIFNILNSSDLEIVEFELIERTSNPLKNDLAQNISEEVHTSHK